MMHALLLALVAFTAKNSNFEHPDYDPVSYDDVYTWMLSFSTAREKVDPNGDLADAIVSNANGAHEAALLTAISYYESKFQSDVIGDHGLAYCPLQVQINRVTRKTEEGWTGKQLAKDPDKCVKSALRILHFSLNICKKLPVSDRLAFYNSGKCTAGIWQSRQRIKRAEKLLVSRKTWNTVPTLAETIPSFFIPADSESDVNGAP